MGKSKTKRVTLKDVAQECGLAVSTVSNILNDNKDSYASAKVKAMVKDTAKRLGYKKNFLSLSLRTQRTFSIGLCIDEVDNETRKYFINRLVQSFNGAGYEVALHAHDGSPEKALESFEFFEERFKDAIVMFLDFDDNNDQAKEQLKAKMSSSQSRVIAVGESFKGILPSIDIARSWAIEDGLKRLDLHLQGRNLASDAKTLVVYKTAFEFRDAFAGVESDRYVHASKVYGLEDFILAWEQLEKKGEKFHSIFFRTDEVAVPSLRWLKNVKNIHIPQDLICLSYDNFSISEYATPPLATYDLNMAELGQLAYQLLKSWIDSDRAPSNDMFEQVQPRFIQRQSLG